MAQYSPRVRQNYVIDDGSWMSVLMGGFVHGNNSIDREHRSKISSQFLPTMKLTQSTQSLAFLDNDRCLCRRRRCRKCQSSNLVGPAFCRRSSLDQTPLFLGPDSNPFLLSENLGVDYITSSSVQEFEPVVDWAALGTFVAIMGVSLLLVRRTAAVEEAVMERDAALTLVRDLKSKSLIGTQDEVAEQKLDEALKRYEQAVLQEEQLRNIVPGVVRIVPPSAGNASEENARVAAKQFLGKDYDIGVPKREVNPNGKLPVIALGILAILGISLTALLVFLSLDPMAASSFLDSL